MPPFQKASGKKRKATSALYKSGAFAAKYYHLKFQRSVR
jgi:hypothetical protein